MSGAEPLLERVVSAISGQYAVEREIGRGGMSVVYQARDIRLNRTVALKVLPPELAYDPAVRARFTREAQTAAQLAHPHIVPIHDVGDVGGIAYLVMAFVSGGNLASLLAHEPRQPIEEVRRLLGEIADALAYAHQRGVVHRDIKPDNILLDRDSGRAMVTDFGIARAMEAGARLTATGNAVGTPAYMSPEQAMGEREIDGRSDIYSLGVLAYQMVTGRVPFTAGNPMALLMKQVGETPRPIAELRPDTPRALREAIERALEKEPDDRWPTAQALKDALDAGDNRAAPWRPPRTPEPLRAVAPRRSAAAREPRAETPVPEPKAGGLVMVQEHLARLTPDQRADLRLWHGRVNLFDRVKAMRGYTLFTISMWLASFPAFALGVEDAPPLVLAPLIPFVMSFKWWKRVKSLREMGIKLRRVLFMPRAKWVIPAPPPSPASLLEKLAPKDVLESPHGAAIRRAAEDRGAIIETLGTLSRADRSLLPDVEATVNGLVDRVVHLAQALRRLDQDYDSRFRRDLEARITAMEAERESPERERRLALLQRQRATLDEIEERRDALARQLDSAGLALRNLRLDLVKLRSSGMQSALSDVTNATQEARALSKEIGTLLEAAREVREL